MITALAFCLAAAVGSLARWQVGRQLPGSSGTLAVNIIGSGALGLLHESGGDARLVFGLAGLGALTTFSTLAIEAIEGRPIQAVRLIAISLVAGTAAAYIGVQLA